ncbi:unnamed protein product [Bemisia tabaci]|uniref:Sodium channel protein Nach n=1 Tax=Bemisia tabaci TaxID=7038 RepID=A0A9P0AEP2_BEMTA|nr:unnamed protein product [Bemisia tabaci]
MKETIFFHSFCYLLWTVIKFYLAFQNVPVSSVCCDQSISILWIVALFSGMWGTYWLSHSTWQRYQKNPTVISMERDYKEWNSSFPALTLCPTTKFDPTALNNLIESRYAHFNNSDRLETFLLTLANATYSSFKDFSDDYDPISSEEYLSAAYEIRVNFTYNMSNTHIQELGTTQLAPILTEMGICYSFNSHLAPYLHPRYIMNRNRTLFPMQPLLMGHPMSGETLAQLMNINSGYVVYIHSPNDSADIATTGFESSMNNFKTVVAVPLTIYSSDEVKQLSVSQRRCRFIHESNLKISPAYSFKFCRMECRIKLSLKLCGCVPFFYPPTGEPICNVKGMKCLAKYEEEMIKLHNLNKYNLDCNCLPACDDVSFVIDSATNMYWFLGTNLNVCLVKYPRMRLRRDLLFGITEVLVSIGGTAGLFLGCSVLSFVEIIYFFSLRLLFFVYHSF